MDNAATKQGHDRQDQDPPPGRQPVDQADPADTQQPTFIVGLGASAGGLDPLEAFFDKMPGDSGMAFVIIQHLSPDYKSLMDELLARHTDMAIRRVEDEMRVQRNTIYLIPPKKQMAIAGGKLRLTDQQRSGMVNLPIDHFFRSLAQDQADRAIGIVMSGSGTDGSRGIVDIHDAGGLTIAQRPRSARFDSMPQAAIETGIIEQILEPEMMPEALINHAADPSRHLIVTDQAQASFGQGYDQVLDLLRAEHPIDFNLYKPTTVRRRIDRRMQLNDISHIDDYAKRLEKDASELQTLFSDLLIGVTRFFRDHEAFDILANECVPQILAEKKPVDPIRIWVAGCGTGEEAYSLAMLFRHHMEKTRRFHEVKVFATDVHRTSLETAAAGVYSRDAMVDVGTAYRDYLIDEGDRFRVTRDIRQMVVFAPHNLIYDAPFTKMDLVSCRNLLIYLKPSIQRNVLSLFHFALQVKGVLFLGASETLGPLGREFQTIDESWKIYRKLRDKRLSSALRLPVGVRPPGPTSLVPVRSTANDPDTRDAYDALLGAVIPSGMLVNRQRQLLHTFGGASRFLAHRDGRASTDLLEQVVDDLRLVVGTGLARALKENKPVVLESIRISTSAGQAKYRIGIRPLRPVDGVPSYAFIGIEPASARTRPDTGQTITDQPDGHTRTDAQLHEASRQRIGELEDEVQHTREHLQATIEELESSNEELQSTNEELVSSNEELQSTNEELHSVNEELNTVNAEYQQKITELAEMSADMENLLASTDIGTIFLDRGLCIRKFTPAASAAFNLRPSDIDRPISDISNNVRDVDLMYLLREALDHGEPIEREVQTVADAPMLMRILPYRTERGEADGLVLTFVDLTAVKQTEEALGESERRFEQTFENVAVGMAHVGLDMRWIRVNQRLCQILGYTQTELLGRPIRDLTHPEDVQEDMTKHQAVAEGRMDGYQMDKRYIRKDGSNVWVSLTVSVQRDGRGRIKHFISVVQDITARKQAEQALSNNLAQQAASNRELSRKNEQLDEFVHTVSHDLKTPLVTVQGYSAVLEKELADGRHDRLANYIPKIRAAIDRMGLLIEDLLSLSRIGRTELRKRDLALNQLVADLTAELESPIAEKQAQLIVQPDMPTLYEDPTQMRQLLMNLLTNALHHGCNDSSAKIELGAHQHDGKVILSVRDHGPGIPEKHQEQVFGLFQRLGRDGKGTGVGLAIVRRIAESRGGRAWVESEPGRGATFKVEMPVNQADNNQAHKD